MENYCSSVFTMVQSRLKGQFRSDILPFELRLPVLCVEGKIPK